MIQETPQQGAAAGPRSSRTSVQAPGQPRRRRRWLRILSALLLTTIILLAGVIAYQVATGPDVSGLAERNPPSTAYIDQYRQRTPGGPLEWTWVPLDRVSPLLRRAVLVGEDHLFYEHGGIEWGTLPDAVAESLSLGGGPRGISTITQQVARNLFLSPERSFGRKLREAVLAKRLEAALDKKRIFEIYLNIAELGPGIYGVEAASQHYFHKPAAEMTEEEAAELAAILPAPSQSRPDSKDGAYRARVGLIRERMNILKDLS
jgi:monofunctional biosynthetic peptidoglycan transglycosylase